MIALVIPAAWLLFFAYTACEGQYDNTLNRWWKAGGFVCLLILTALTSLGLR